MSAYQSFLLANASQITAIESSLRSLTYFLPGRFKDAELAGEAIYSALNLLGFYHDSILTDIKDQAESDPLIALPENYTPSQHTRYTNHFARSSPLYRHASQLLVILSQTELLIEMLAVRFHRQRLNAKGGHTSRFGALATRVQPMDVVVLIEATKAVLRLTLWKMTGERTTLASNPLPEREVDPIELEAERKRRMEEMLLQAEDERSLELLEASRGDLSASMRAELPLTSLSGRKDRSKWDTWKGKRTGLTRPTLRSLRPGAKEAAAAGLLRPLPPHPLAPSPATTGGSNGSDSDDTIVVDLEEEEEEIWARQQVEHATLAATSASASSRWTEAQVNNYLLSRTLAPTDVVKPFELVRPVMGNVGRLAEILWILRPLLYVFAIRRYGKHSPFPFYLSLFLEFFARQIRKRSFSPNLGFGQKKGSSSSTSPLLAALAGGGLGGMMTGTMMSILTGSGAGNDEAKRRERPVSTVEADEWARRDSAFWWYLLRGPVWDSFTKPRLQKIIGVLEHRPLLGLLGGILNDYLPLVDEYHFYTSK